MQEKFAFVGNWKMQGHASHLVSFLRTLSQEMSSDFIWIFCPPCVYLSLAQAHQPEGLFLGSQTCSPHLQGAHTGEISAQMLRDMGCQFILVGHSERRSSGEKPETIQQQMMRIVECNMTPILCVGETQRMSLDWALAYVLAQIEESLGDLDSQSIWIAYEPVWAIGTGQTADATWVHGILSGIKACYPKSRILYGGSVNQDAIKPLMTETPVEGFLIGKASLEANTWLALAKEALLYLPKKV